MLKVMMYPHPDSTLNGESGIHTLIRKYLEHFPSADMEIVSPKAESWDVLAIHAGTANEFGNGPMVAHLHGLYWTADYDCAPWEYKANKDVITNIIAADAITVPSPWVAKTLRRGARINPFVLPHGIDYQEWETDQEHSGYVLWNKNRAADVCDPTPVKKLAEIFNDINFISTFAPENSPNNVTTTGVLPHDRMRELVKSSCVYLATTKETFGIGILEAMAAGVPVLGYNHGGAEEIIEHCKTGYLAKPDDINDLARGLKYCLKYRDILGENAKILVRKFTWKEVAVKAKEIYEYAIEKHNKPDDVAVVIPCYNKGDTVERAIVSVVNQTKRAAEIIVVNNNSTDEIDFAELEQKYPVTIVNEPSQGVAHARNHGIYLSDSKYICCLDGDDEIEPEFLEKCVNTLENDRTLGLSYTKLKAIFPDGREIVSEWPPDDYDFDQFLVRKNQVPTCCVFRKDLAERVGGFRQRYAPRGAGSEDAEFWMRLGSLGYAGKLATNEALFLYHVGGATSQAGYSEPDWHVWHPWTRDKKFPFTSLARPESFSHPVHQYDKPKISVVIPVGPDHGGLVIDALDSLEAQEMRDWEAIVVWDQENEVDEKLVIAYPHVQFLHTGGKGSGYARNRGAELANSRLLLFLDADDLLLPDALSHLYSEYLQSAAIVYSDYLGRAYIEDLHEVAKLRMMDRINSYDENTSEAVIRYSAFEYDCDKAQNQPRIESDGQFYIWCLICSLVPKEFHDEIGGFDEDMPSWEDWDYWLRMARAGKCFTKVSKPLAQYRFYTGTRRILANPGESGESGRQLSSSLLKYLREKYEGIEKMPCSGCGKRRAAPTPQALSAESMKLGTVQNMSSSDLVMVELIDGNVGGHQIAILGTSYGQRRHGQRFLMQKNHADADPRVIIVNQETSVVVEPETVVTEPEPIVKRHVPRMVEEPAPNPVIEEEVSTMPEIIPQDDLTELYGVNEENVSKLTDAGIRTFSGLSSFTEYRIKSMLGVTSRTAKRILKEAKQKI